MHKLILASGAGSSLVVTITIIVDTSAQVEVLPRHAERIIVKYLGRYLDRPTNGMNRCPQLSTPP